LKTIETARLILREYTESDAPAFFRLNSDPEVMRYVPDDAMTSIEQAREVLIDHPIKDYQERGFGRWACLLKETDEHIGFCGLKFLKEINDVDLGFRFVPSQWGKGLATEAAQASLRFGFDELALDQIMGFAELENRGSIRVLEKIGMQFVEMVKLLGLDMAKYVIQQPR
jgi:RimJ/RimL family protein N-acetyltransferase